MKKLFCVWLLATALGTLPGAEKGGVSDGAVTGENQIQGSSIGYPAEGAIWQGRRERVLVVVGQDCPPRSIVLELIGTVGVDGMTVRQVKNTVCELRDRSRLASPHVRIGSAEYVFGLMLGGARAINPGPGQFPPKRNLA